LLLRGFDILIPLGKLLVRIGSLTGFASRYEIASDCSATVSAVDGEVMEDSTFS